MEIRLRRAEENDAHMLLQWRNDPITAANSINQSKISWEDHKAWFDKALRDPNRIIMIGMFGEQYPFGMVRFDHLIDGWEISIVIDPNLRTKGMGRSLLEEGIKFFTETQENTTLYATIRGENVASLIIFLASGFRLTEYNSISGLAYLKREPK
jgi:RimJ/RimL family protein N-acetyltransferase